MTDILDFGPDKPPWRPSRRLVVVAVVLVILAVGGWGTAAFVKRDKPAATPVVTAPPSGVPCRPGPGRDSPAGQAPAALIIGCTGAGSALNRRDPGAEKGPWTVVVRRNGGSLGRTGAVITFPVVAPAPTLRQVAVGRVAGRAGAGTVIWPIGGGYARIRGDLAEAELIAIAIDTSVVAGRPATDPPAGYAVTFGGPYRAPEIHEMRYSSIDVQEDGALGAGMTFTGVARGGGFEDQLFATAPIDAGRIGRRPAVISTVFGGNGAIAWEPAPGVVAYVGYSGSMLGDKAVAALRRLAERTRALTDEQWQSVNPQTADQTNEPG